MTRLQTRRLFFLLLILINVGCDQVSKIIVREKVNYHEQIQLIENHLTLTKVENTGAFLSMGDELPQVMRFILLSLFPILVLAMGLYFLFFQKDLEPFVQIGICFLLGGGIGNIYDRLKFGSVTDFLHIDLGLISTGVFNFADMSIMTGISILFVQSFKRKKKPSTV